MSRVLLFRKESSRILPFCCTFLLFLFCFSGISFAFHHKGEQSTATTKATLSVHFSGIKESKGRIVLSVYDSPEHYRKQPLQVLRVATATAQQHGISVALPAGTYAITVYQDANGNGKIDRNFMGIPTELGGFSNNPRIVMGPPSFKRCAFRLEGNQQISILLH